jgi:hypothetical protein
LPFRQKQQVPSLADLIEAPDRTAFSDEAEVMDIDEAALRKGHIAPQLYGLARVPVAATGCRPPRAGRAWIQARRSPAQHAEVAETDAAQHTLCHRAGQQRRRRHAKPPGTRRQCLASMPCATGRWSGAM